MTFLEELKEQRWDDHRYYHHSRINQSLHLISSLTFIVVYYLLFTQPVYAVLLGWFFAMISRQIGHFFFEPKGYDQENAASFEHKEDIKIGYNLSRKRFLLAIFALVPVVLYFVPTAFGLLPEPLTGYEFVENLSRAWLTLGVGAVVGRAIWLSFSHSPQTGLVWAVKIVTDPFHDVYLYWRSPLHVMRGELLDPMIDADGSRIAH